MKTFLRCLIATLCIAAGTILVILYIANEDTSIHPRRDAVLTMIGMVAFYAIGYYTLNYTPISSKLFGIHTCIEAKRYTKQKSIPLYNATGCHTYRELYKYASQELYYTRWV